MERRRESRISSKPFSPNVLARIQPLEKDELAFDATLVDVSGHGMRFLTSRAVPPDTALKIEIGDALILAETVHCSHSSQDHGSNQHYVLGVKVDQVLSSLADLLRLQRALVEQQDPRGAPDLVPDKAAADK